MFLKKIAITTCLLTLFHLHAEQSQYKVGLLVVATGKYINFAESLITSARTHFCSNHKVTFFVFTDGDLQNPANDIITIYQNRLGWPYDTMMRFAMYAKSQDLLKSMDYLFVCDADMLFVDTVGDEILGELVGTQHPGYVNKVGTYERKALSTACIHPQDKPAYYFAGGFYGGKTENVLNLTHSLTKNINIDLTNNIIAIWHDESHLNRYFFENKPSIVLSPSYCYPESWKLPYKKRLLALDKNHQEIRK